MGVVTKTGRSSGRATAELAEFATGVTFAALPPAAVEAAKRCLYDAVGVMLVGASTAWGREVRDYVCGLATKPEATLIGFRDRVSCLDAAWANGIFGKTPELEDGHRLMAMFHLAPTVIPASLALAEREGKSGRDLLAAIVVGYEVAVRLGAAMGVSPHKPARVIPTVSCGVMGVAAAAARLLGLSAERLQTAWNVAALEVPASAGREVSSLRTITVGSAARVGLQACLMAGGLSVIGSGLTFEGRDGYCARMAGTVREGKLVRDLGSSYHIARVYFKPFPSCRYTHAPITALLRLLERQPLRPREVKEIVVCVGAEGRIVQRAELIPETAPFHERETSAKFSIPYVLASTVVRGTPTLEHFYRDALDDPEVRSLMRRVKVIYDRTHDLMPGRMPATVKVSTRSGKSFVSRVDYPKGEPEDALTEHEFRAKFRALVSRALGENRVRPLEELLEAVGELEDLRALAGALRA